jgi:hypothetical protein
MHTLHGVKEKFVNDLKEAVRLIMTQDDRQLGPKVCFLIVEHASNVHLPTLIWIAYICIWWHHRLSP